jgi:hypothetical protein
MNRMASLFVVAAMAIALTPAAADPPVEHRFGGGTDDDCDPHVIDILAGKGQGGADEVAAQHAMLKYERNPDGTLKQGALLKMVRK